VQRPGFLPQVERQGVAITIVMVLHHEHTPEAQCLVCVPVLDGDVRIYQLLTFGGRPDERDVGHEHVGSLDLVEDGRRQVRAAGHALPIGIQLQLRSRLTLQRFEDVLRGVRLGIGRHQISSPIHVNKREVRSELSSAAPSEREHAVEAWVDELYDIAGVREVDREGAS
jgi:hypothetical protein